MSFTKIQDEHLLTYKARTLNDLYLVLSDIRSHEPELMEERWWGWDDGSIVTPGKLSIDSTEYDAKESDL